MKLSPNTSISPEADYLHLQQLPARDPAALRLAQSLSGNQQIAEFSTTSPNGDRLGRRAKEKLLDRVRCLFMVVYTGPTANMSYTGILPQSAELCLYKARSQIISVSLQKQPS